MRFRSTTISGVVMYSLIRANRSVPPAMKGASELCCNELACSILPGRATLNCFIAVPPSSSVEPRISHCSQSLPALDEE